MPIQCAHLSLLEYRKQRQALDFICIHSVLVYVRVNCDEFQICVQELFTHCVEYRCHRLTGPTPVGVKVYYHRNL